MKRPKDEYVPNQGCGILFLIVVSAFFLISIPVFKFAYEAISYMFEEQILLTSDSPDDTYHIQISTEGPSTRILIKEETTSAEQSADIVKGGKEVMKPGDIEIQWTRDSVAEIKVEGREDTFHYFIFDAYAEEEKIERLQKGIQ